GVADVEPRGVGGCPCPLPSYHFRPVLGIDQPRHHDGFDGARLVVLMEDERTGFSSISECRVVELGAGVDDHHRWHDGFYRPERPIGNAAFSSDDTDLRGRMEKFATFFP